MRSGPPLPNTVALRLLQAIGDKALPNVLTTREQSELRLLTALRFAWHDLDGWHLTDNGRAAIARPQLLEPTPRRFREDSDEATARQDYLDSNYAE